MIAVDTNILVRYLIGDDRDQLEIASEFIEQRLSAINPGFVSLVVLAELAWVLMQRYAVPAPTLADRIRMLLQTPVFYVENADVVERALQRTEGDFTDVLIHEIGLQAGCQRTTTFDRKFARLAGVELLGGR